MGRRFGDPLDPLLVSVRSGGKFSMPGMMETVLDVGLNDDSVDGLARQSGDPRFAWDSYRRLVQMFGSTVLGIVRRFAEVRDEVKRDRGVAPDTDLDQAELRQLVARFRTSSRRRPGARSRSAPREQLDLAVRAVFESWNTERAAVPPQERIPEDLGTAVNVQAMVFGNRGPTPAPVSASPGTRRPAPRRVRRLPEHAQGEDVVAGIRNTCR